MDLILLELLLVLTVAMGLGFWQLYDVNKELKKDDKKDERKDDGKDVQAGPSGDDSSGD
jgi:hypothetical protein